MKRFLKIFGITLGCLVAVVIIAASVAVWWVFTPKRLTPIVRDLAKEYILCEHEIGDVELTFFSTFPEFGLKTGTLCLINPMEGAPSDTLLYAPQVIARVNVTAFLNDKALIVNELRLEDMQACVYINALGENNFSVFRTSDSTEADTSAFQLPFETLEIKGLSFSANELTFLDEKDTIDAVLSNMSIRAQAGSWDDMRIRLAAPDVTLAMQGTQYAEHLALNLDLPMALDLNNMAVTLREAKLALNEFGFQLDGAAALKPEITVDMRLATGEWGIQPLLSLVPAKFTEGLKDLSFDGLIRLTAHAKGMVKDGILPVVDADVVLKNAQGKYKPLPYTLRDVEADLSAHLDLNDGNASSARIRSLSAKTRDTKLGATGLVDHLMGDMFLDIQANADVNLKDIAYFLPKTMVVDGRTKGTVGLKMRLEDLTAMRLEKGLITGNLTLTDLSYHTDSMEAVLPGTTALKFTLPNTDQAVPMLRWLKADIQTEALQFRMSPAMQANLAASTINLETGNMLSNDPKIYASAYVESKGELLADYDTIHAYLRAPAVSAYVEYDTKAEKALPSFRASIGADVLKADYGQTIHAETYRIDIKAASRYNPKGQNILLQLNPKIGVDLHTALIRTAYFDREISIPQITFDYSNRRFTIETSQFHIGNSDFALVGEVTNMGQWMQHKGVLTGELNFTSQYTDINELMALFSADSGSEEEPAQTAQPTQTTQTTQTTETNEPAQATEPFLVPTSVDLALNTHIYEADVFNQRVRNMGGKLYVKDGTLVLEEMGFVCKAAKMQLTAMYRTPRKNHLYVGLDYHMLDVNIEELISMIPQIDTMLPMLKSFRGEAEFHLAAETYMKQDYSIKPSTLRGACSIFGKDLVVLDSETFSQIAKLLMFSKKTENKVDSLSAEITLYKKEVDIYPFCVSMDNYMVALGGRHNLDMTFDYHINVLSPIYLGVDVGGTFDDLDIRLAPCRYAKDFKPLFHGKVDTQSAELRALIRESMRRNVKPQADEQTTENPQ